MQIGRLLFLLAVGLSMTPPLRACSRGSPVRSPGRSAQAGAASLALLRLRGGGQRKGRGGGKAGSGTRAGRRREHSGEREDIASKDDPAGLPVDIAAPIQWTQARRVSQSRWDECRKAASNWGMGASEPLLFPRQDVATLPHTRQTCDDLESAIDDFDSWLERSKQHTSADSSTSFVAAVGAGMGDEAPAEVDRKSVSAGSAELAESCENGGQLAASTEGAGDTGLYRLLLRLRLPDELVQLLVLRLQASEMMWKNGKGPQDLLSWDMVPKVRTSTFKATLLWVLTLFFHEIWFEPDDGLNAGDAADAGHVEETEKVERESLAGRPEWCRLFREKGANLMELDTEEEVARVAETNWELPLRKDGGLTVVLMMGLAGSTQPGLP